MAGSIIYIFNLFAVQNFQGIRFLFLTGTTCPVEQEIVMIEKIVNLAQKSLWTRVWKISTFPGGSHFCMLQLDFKMKSRSTASARLVDKQTNILD